MVLFLFKDEVPKYQGAAMNVVIHRKQSLEKAQYMKI